LSSFEPEVIKKVFALSREAKRGVELKPVSIHLPDKKRSKLFMILGPCKKNHTVANAYRVLSSTYT
jgi:hypothetical protein